MHDSCVAIIHTGPIFTDSEKFSRIGNIRKKFEDNLCIQKRYGDICLAYQLHMRDQLHEALRERDELRENLDRQRETHDAEKEEMRQRFVEESRLKDQQIAEADAEKNEKARELEEVQQLCEERGQEIEGLNKKNDEINQCMCNKLCILARV